MNIGFKLENTNQNGSRARRNSHSRIENILFQFTTSNCITVSKFAESFVTGPIARKIANMYGGPEIHTTWHNLICSVRVHLESLVPHRSILSLYRRTLLRFAFGCASLREDSQVELERRCLPL